METKLWSWLKKDAKRQQFYCEEGCKIGRGEFMELLSNKLKENDVPATVTNVTVKWDESNAKNQVHMLRVDGSGNANPFTCLVQFDTVGKFAFVEEKVFVTPPNLPETPGVPCEIDEDLYKRRGMLIWGAIAILAGFYLFQENAIVGLIAMAIGAFLGYLGYLAFSEIKSMRAHNEWCQRALEAWNAEWDRWENDIYIHAFQEGTNGRMSRVYDAAYECIKQVCADVFAGKMAVEEDESNSMSELEQLIARRKDEYK